MIKYYFALFCMFICLCANAQKDATYKETTKKYLTYPFSDPDPIPSDKIYPYFRFDGFTDKAVEKEWKVVMLENDYISVQIMPEIGGKIWSAIDRKSGKSFFYNNDVVKFRDIAMRGPWVSGGIEANYGIIGHTPNSATPVDYLVRSNDDGSVSCFTSTLDLLTRTRWVLEIKLEKDKAYFTTHSFWFNSTGIEQPYYTWMNAGIPVGKGLKFLYPGNHYIGHDGSAHKWSKDSLGHDLSYYSQNDFGSSKSYHVLGAHSNYFGALWEEEDFGMIHYAKREDKLGKKIFLWAQSEQGRVWEDLLTDKSGQYVEIQSGRLFNQNQFNSSSTPFKQIGFAPYTSDSWTEYWYPFKGIGGFSGANLVGAFDIEYTDESMTIRLSPVQPLRDSLFVYNKEGDQIAASYIKAEPLESVTSKLSLPKEEEASRLKVKGYAFDLEINDADQQLGRPVQIADGFNEDGAYGLYLQGRDLARFRDYRKAESKIQKSLTKDSLFMPSLVEYGKLKYFRMQYDSAFYYLKKALSIDTYDGAANYYYGLAASKLFRNNDALDGFEVASLTSEYRNAAYTALSHQYLKEKDFKKTKDYALSSLKSNPDNIDALQILCIIARINDDKKLLKETEDKIRSLNPLNHFIRFEDYLLSISDNSKNKFTGLIRNEMPVETYLELAIWYTNLGLEKESERVLELAPQNTETLYWLAWLNRKENAALSKNYLLKANESTPSFVFPFREETSMVLQWAANKSTAWQQDYLLALINDYRGNQQDALEQMKGHSEKIDFAPFYMLRARLYDADSLTSKLGDVDKAIQLSPTEWRYGIIKSRMLSKLNKDEEALRILEKYYQADRNNYIVGLELVKSQIINNRYQEAEKNLSTLHVLPFEGATDARRYYRETKLMLAHQALEAGQFKKALLKVNEAEEWPNRLGVGKPYPELINADLENWMKAFIYKKMGKAGLSQEYLKKTKNQSINEKSYIGLIKSITQKTDQRIF